MNIFTNIDFLSKWYFLLIILLPILLYFFYKRLSKWINFIFIRDIKKVFKRNSFKFYLKLLLLLLIMLNFIIILANPNIINSSQKVKKNGIDIVISLDISGSMEAEDLKPNRIEAAKGVINNFIKNLKTDRLWLVVFAWKPFTSIPLTFDYNILKETIQNIWTKNIDQRQRWLNWTAIWDSILMAETLFKAPKDMKLEDYKKREKVIILLTDWDANVWVNPILAWLSAKDKNIKIYTIWIGSKEWWLISYNVWPFKKQYRIPPLNDKVLKQIASDTSAKYFRAEDNNSFEEIFNELSLLEKNDINIDIKKQYKEYYDIFLYSLLILLIIFTYLMISGIEISPHPNPLPKGEGTWVASSLPLGEIEWGLSVRGEGTWKRKIL